MYVCMYMMYVSDEMDVGEGMWGIKKTALTISGRTCSQNLRLSDEIICVGESFLYFAS